MARIRPHYKWNNRLFSIQIEQIKKQISKETQNYERKRERDKEKEIKVIEISDDTESDDERHQRRRERRERKRRGKHIRSHTRSKSRHSRTRRRTRSKSNSIASPRGRRDYHRSRRRSRSFSHSRSRSNHRLPSPEYYDSHRSSRGAPAASSAYEKDYYYGSHATYSRSRSRTSYKVMDPKQVHKYECTPSSMSEEEDESPLTVMNVLRFLSALEEHLGSLGPKVIYLLGKALAMEKQKANSANEILLNDDYFAFFETMKEKFKGLILLRMLDNKSERAVKKAVNKIEILIQQVHTKDAVAKDIIQDNPKKNQPSVNTPNIQINVPNNQQQQQQQPAPQAFDQQKGYGRDHSQMTSMGNYQYSYYNNTIAGVYNNQAAAPYGGYQQIWDGNVAPQIQNNGMPNYGMQNYGMGWKQEHNTMGYNVWSWWQLR